MGPPDQHESHPHFDNGRVEGVSSIQHADGDLSPTTLGTLLSSSAPSPMSAPSVFSHSVRSPHPEHIVSSSESSTVPHPQDSNQIVVSEHQTPPAVNTSYFFSDNSSQDIANAISNSFLPTTNLPCPSTPLSKSPSPPRLGSVSDFTVNSLDRRLSPGKDNDSNDDMGFPSAPRIVAQLPLRVKRSSNGAVSQSKRVKLSDKKGKHSRIAVTKVAVTLGEDDEDDEDDKGNEDRMDIGTDEEDTDESGDGGGNDDILSEEEDAVSIPRLVVHGDKEVYLTMNCVGLVLIYLFLLRGKSHLSYTYIRPIKPDIMHIKGDTM